MKRIPQVLAFTLVFALLLLLTKQLFYAKPTLIPSPLINESVPQFKLTTLNHPYNAFSEKELATGGVKLLTFWATWCDACALEHAMLLKIKNDYHIPIYGILYKDNPKEAEQWLAQYGNPYQKIGNDDSGDVAIDFGVYGTPETYIINKEGKIIYRQVGAIDEITWQQTLLPIIKENS